MPPATDPDIQFTRNVLLDRAVYADVERTFHVTLQSHPKIQTFTSKVRAVLWEAVMTVNVDGRIDLVAACLMPDHLHLLARPARQDLLSFIHDWKSFTTRLAWKAGNRGALWQPRMWDRAIRSYEDERDTINYVLENPIRAGLVEHWDDWPWT